MRKLRLECASFLSTRHAEKLIRNKAQFRLYVSVGGLRQQCHCGEITQFEYSSDWSIKVLPGGSVRIVVEPLVNVSGRLWLSHREKVIWLFRLTH